VTHFERVSIGKLRALKITLDPTAK